MTDPTATTPENVDDRIDAWHEGDGQDQPLHQYLGWTQGQYAAWVERSEFPDGPTTTVWTGPTLAPDDKGCYGWPRTCEHADDLDCTIAEAMEDPEFAVEWERLSAEPPSRRVRAWRNNQASHGRPVAVKPALAGRRHGW